MNPLSKFSNDEIEFRLKDLVVKERKLLHIILEHIKEVDSRKLYLARAFSTLKEYLVQECGYSGSAADRRIDAAKLLRDVPAVAEKIQTGELNLTQIGELSRAIKDAERVRGEKVSCMQKNELVEMISGMTTRDTQRELAVTLDIPIKEYDKQRVQKDESVRLEITLSKEQYEKLMQCQDLASHILSQNRMDPSLASVIEVLADKFLSNKIGTPKQISGGEEMTSPNTAAVPMRVNKSLTPKTRNEIFARDQGCQFKDRKTGRVCGSTRFSQVDHKTSQWAGGDHNQKNLQRLCANHNQFKYQQETFISVR
jgi:hypothetical protein